MTDMIIQMRNACKSGDGRTHVVVRSKRDTLWLSQAQMAELFGTTALGEHLKGRRTGVKPNYRVILGSSPGGLAAVTAHAAIL